MARNGGGGESLAVERRRVALRALLDGGEASSPSLPPAGGAVRPTRGLLRGLRCTSAAATQAHSPAAAADAAPPSAYWRGLGCTSAAAAQAHAPAAAVDDAVRSSVEWRGVGCTSAAVASQAHAPVAAVGALPSSADWRGRRRRKVRGGGGGVVSGEGMGGDVWCAPGTPFAAEASSVDCVVAPHQPVLGTRRRAQAQRPHRERPGAPASRRATMREHMSSSPMNSPPHHGMPFIQADHVPSGSIRHISGRRQSRVRVEEEMMFRTRLLLGRMRVYDQYQDWRLDVDNMTYEELLDLEDRIGYVSTGLREDEIIRSLRIVRYSAFNRKHFSTEMDRRCSICQEEFEANEETGKLSCGHWYHVHCITQWLSRKNSCPVCKTAVAKS